ncbi:hypothetical protein [Candidatus Protochlamydia amoebophila]|uniref:G domain-containing protein n=1 Tax=Protochlamydia amoebophila (strain UWE25) TaxID=264201 RepID=A0A2P9H9W3_PARUW|nr:hypothetical protein [Candidatus Protochlamydia amoebophila]SPJ31783.1 unnamed protein product [Candidatus Protochlamydia amoebophila UWE25]
MNIQGWNIIDVAREIFPQAQCETRGNECFLTLQPNSHETIKYTQTLNDIFRQKHANSKSVKKLKSVFQKYQYKIIRLAELEQKISKTIEKLQRSLLSSQNTSSQTSSTKKMEELLTKPEARLRASTLASQTAHGKNVILFIGTTGCGKSTTMNYLAGCTMQKVDRKAAGLPLGSKKKIILAQNPLTKIGYKDDKSQTSYPKICDDNDNKFAYCDCPGMGDTKGTEVEIYNAICIKEITEKARSVKGILFFIEYSDFSTGKGQGISNNLKYLQLLLKDFKKYQRAILFLITKVFDDDVDLLGMKKQILKRVKKLADSKEDLKLAEFCQQIIDSNILKDELGERVLICDPCGATALQEKNKMLATMRDFSSFQSTTNKQDAFGYPLSQKAELHIEKTKTFILSNARSHLSKLEEATKTYWQKRSIPRSVENLKVCCEEITCWLEELETPTFAKIALGTSYLQVSQTLTDHLKQCVIYWEKLKEIYPPKNKEEEETYQLDVCLEEDLKKFVVHLRSIQENIMHYANLEALSKALEAYEIQKDLASWRQKLQIDKLDDLTLDQYLKIDGALGCPIPFRKQLEEIIISENSQIKLKEIKDVLTLHLLNPFKVDKIDKRIEVNASIPCVAFSSILKEVESHFQTSQAQAELIISVNKSKEATLYLDCDLTGKELTGIKGRTVIINAAIIKVIPSETKKEYKIALSGTWLRPGSILFNGQLVGTEKIKDNCLFLYSQTETDNVDHPVRLIGYEWRS